MRLLGSLVGTTESIWSPQTKGTCNLNPGQEGLGEGPRTDMASPTRSTAIAYAARRSESLCVWDEAHTRANASCIVWCRRSAATPSGQAMP